MVTRADILAELERRKSPPPQETFGEALLRAPGAAGRMAVGGIAQAGGLIADPIGQLAEYVTGQPMMPTKEAALSLYDSLTGGQYAPRNKLERVTQSAGEFVTGGGAFGAAAKMAGAPAIAQAIGLNTKRDIASQALGGAGLQSAQEAGLSPEAQIGVSLAASMLPSAGAGIIQGVMPKTSRAAVNAQLKSGGKITVGGVVGGDILPRIESSLSQAPLVGGKIRATRADVAQGLQQRIDDVADVLSTSGQRQQADVGSFIKSATETASKNLRQGIAKQYDDVFDMLPEGIMADTTASRGLLDELKQVYQYNDDALKFLNKKALTKLTGGEIPARQLKLIRGQIDDIADAAKSKGMTRFAGDLKGLSRQLNDDIKATASQSIEGAGAKIAQIDEQYKNAMDLTDRITKWIGNKGDEQLAVSFGKLGVQAGKTSTKGANISAMEDLFKLLPKSDAQELSSHLLRTMGRNEQGQLNALSFANEYQSLTPRARTLLFGRSLPKESRQALDTIVDYASSSKMTLNPSGTGGQTIDIASAVGAGLALASNPSNLGFALLPYFVNRGLSSQTLAKAINKLPREAFAKSYSRPNLQNLLMSHGASKEDVNGVSDYIDSNNRRAEIIAELDRRKNASTSLAADSGIMGNTEQPFGNSGIGSGDYRASVTPDFYRKLAQAESAGNPLAKNPDSSASGLYQFTDKTWNDTVEKYGAPYGITEDMKNNPFAQEAMVKHLTQENSIALASELGRQPTDGELYIAHFMGSSKAKRILSMRGSREPAARVFPKEAKANRPIFFDGKRPRTIQEVIAILERKVS